MTIWDKLEVLAKIVLLSVCLLASLKVLFGKYPR